tara:strand:- start:654 stop:2477 length:1824 start_codon:yes stop_codon:yes gene_type:complete
MFFEEKKNQFRSFTRRSLFLIFFKLLLFFAVGFRLYKIQIKESSKYNTLSNKNSVTLKIIYPTRGIILDSKKNVIAKNKISYDLYIMPEEVKNINEVVKKISSIINVSFRHQKKIVELSNQAKKFEAIKILDDLSWKELETIEANIYSVSGLHLVPRNKREYPYSKYFSHILGYTGQPNEKDLETPYIKPLRTLDIGRTGIEKYFNEKLIGVPGSREVEINAFGREIRDIKKTNSIQGLQIHLSIDANVQKIIYEELKDIISGSVVVSNVNSGEILGMLSIPLYDPNKIISKPNLEYWNKVTNNPLSPLNNRVTQGLYAPGSTFKMIVALSGLELGIIDKNHSIFCEGKIEYGDRIYHCWKTKGHGKVNLTKAIKESCDCYFYDLAQKIGINNIYTMAKKFGLGDLTNIQLPSEKKGLIPNKKWKKNYYNESWFAGETLISAIGQGYVLTTPIQLLLMTSMIANNGKKINLTLLKNNDGLLQKDNNFQVIKINPNNLQIIKDSMFKVVNEIGGTAYSIRSNPNEYLLSGKTGTSQVKKITLEERESEDFRKKEKAREDKDHSLFVGFMPSNKPKYAISVVIEHGGSGSATAAPIAKNIFNKIYRLGL